MPDSKADIHCSLYRSTQMQPSNISGSLAVGNFVRIFLKDQRMENAIQEEENKQVIREFTKIFKNEHNVDGVGHLFDTKNFIHHFRAPLPAGFEGLRQVGIMMNGAFPIVVATEEDLIASGDRIVERSSVVATHKGSLMGEPPTNKRVAWSEIHIYRLKYGKVCEHWAEIAMMELLQQIGLLPLLGQSGDARDRKATG